MNALLKQPEPREPELKDPPGDGRVLQLALRTLHGIRQRYELERAAHPGARLHSVHVALDASDMVWINATIAALQDPAAGGTTEAPGRPPRSS